MGAVVLGGFGVLAAAGGTIFAIDAAATYADAEEACPERTTCPTDEGFELSHEARRAGNLATAAFVVAGAAAGGAVVLWWTAPSDSEAGQAAAIGVGPGGLWVEGRF